MDSTKDITKAYTNPGLSPEALRAKRLEEQKVEIYEAISGLTHAAVETIEDVMLNAEKDSDRLRAAQDLLDRAGMKQAQEINVTHTNQESPVTAIMNKINALKPAPQDEPDEIVDAEVLDGATDE